MKDLSSGLSAVVDVPSAAIRNGNAATNGGGADLAGFNGATVQFFSGTLTDGSVACKVQESDDNSAWADAAATDIVGGANSQTLAATDDSVVKELGYIGKKRYIRGVMTQSGATTGGFYGSLIQRGFPVKAPV
jgi:hypothetical protein